MHPHTSPRYRNSLWMAAALVGVGALVAMPAVVQAAFAFVDTLLR